MTSATTITLAAAQLRIVPELTRAGLIRLLDQWCVRAKAAGAGLLVLPEYGWLVLAEGKRLPGPGRWPDLAEAYLDAVRAAARERSICILAGTAVEKINGGWRSCSTLLDSGGEACGRQYKIHLNRIDRRLGLEPGREIELMDGPFGPMAVLIGGDARIPEAARAARLRGAELLLQPAAALAHDGVEESPPAVALRAMENQVPALSSHLVGHKFGYEFKGRSRIFTLAAQTAKGDGLVAASRSANANGLVVGTLKPHGIARERDKMDFMVALNSDFARKYMVPEKFAAATAATGGVGRNKVRAAAVQMKLEFFHEPKRFVDKIQGFYERAAREKAELIVFPEDTGTLLLGIYLHPMGLFSAYQKGYEEFSKLLNRESGLREYLFSELSAKAHEVYHETFSTFSHQYRMNTVTGTTYVPERKGIYNTAYIYDSRGRMVGTQKKIHLHYVEREWKLDRADRVGVFDLPVGRLGVAICMDSHYPEVGRALRLEGAQIIADCSAYPDRYMPIFASSGLWGRVQDNGVFGVKSVMVGDIFPRWRLRGRAVICAPTALTGDRSGVLAQSRNSTGESLIAATLDMARLQRWLDREDPVGKISADFLASSLPSMYNQA